MLRISLGIGRVLRTEYSTMPAVIHPRSNGCVDLISVFIFLQGPSLPACQQKSRRKALQGAWEIRKYPEALTAGVHVTFLSVYPPPVLKFSLIRWRWGPSPFYSNFPQTWLLFLVSPISQPVSLSPPPPRLPTWRKEEKGSWVERVRWAKG